MSPPSSSPPMSQCVGQRPHKIASGGPHKSIVKLDNVQFLSRLSKNQEIVGGESRLMAKENGNSEMDANAKMGYKKNGSKPGRRLKKISDRKGFFHQTPLQNSSYPNCIGASNDDFDDLLAAANHARIAPYLACSSTFWKKMEPVFASVSSEDKSFLSQEENKSFSERHDVDKPSNGSVTLYQTVLSALIIENDSNTLEEDDAFCVPTYDTYNLNGFEPRNSGMNSSRSSVINNIRQDDHSEVELLTGISRSFRNTRQMLETERYDRVSLGCRYDEMCLDDKILLELQSIGLCPETMPGLEEEENGTIQHEINQLKTRLHQQEVKKKAYLDNISKGVENNSGVRDLERLAMDRLVELAYRKLLATRRRSRSLIHKVPKHVALAFGRTTIARCRKFEKLGTSCFNEPLFQDIISAPIENEPQTKFLSDDVFAINGPSSNRGKKKEPRKTKQKPKPKPRQKTGQIPPPGNGPVNKFVGPRHPTGPTWPSANRTGQLVDNRNPSIDDLDPLDELGVGSQDLASFLIFAEQDPEDDFAGGLDVPMDDLTELF